MRRDPTQFRERFKRWKAGEQVYDKGLPKFEDGKDSIDFYKNVYEYGQNKPYYLHWVKQGLTEEQALRATKYGYNSYPDSYSFQVQKNLPDVVIHPPKDGAVDKMRKMIPDKNLRTKFYEDLYNNERSVYADVDKRLFINRLYQLYKKSGEPSIKSTKSLSNFIVPVIQFVTGNNIHRPNYNPLLNIIHAPDMNPNSIVAELSHAYQYHGTDTPRNYNWIKQWFSLPSDIKINGKSGYERPGNYEYVAHEIIEPYFNSYLTNPNVKYQDVHDLIQLDYADIK